MGLLKPQRDHRDSSDRLRKVDHRAGDDHLRPSIPLRHLLFALLLALAIWAIIGLLVF